MRSLRIIAPLVLASALLAGPALAQAPAEAPPPLPSPVETAPATALTQPADRMAMNFRDAPVELVLREMSAQLGLVVINPERAQGRVSIVSARALSADEATAALGAVLKASGYTAIRNGRQLHIVSLTEARSANVPVRSGSDPARMGTSDEFITQVIPLRYADSEELREDLQPLIPAYATLTSNQSSNTLLYTATEADVRHVVEIVNALDVHLAEADTVRVFQLEFAQAAATARLITDIFNAERGNQAQSREQMRREFFQRMRGGGGEEGGGTGGTVRQQRVAAAADDQTNAIVVSAPPDVMTIIADVVAQLDADPTAEESIFVYPLTNAKANDLEPVLQNIFSESAGTPGGRAQQGGGFRGRQGQPAAETSVAAGAMVADLAGKVYVVAEETTNSLLVRTAPRYFDRVRTILDELDRPIRQVLIKVLIAEITHDASLDLGVEWSVLNINIEGGTATVGTDFGVQALGSGLVARYTSLDFQAALRALATVGKLDILSRPYLLASENQQANIMVGEEVPFITNSRVTDTGQIINTIEYRNLGIILSVTPYIGPDGMVILDVEQEISSITGQTVIVSEDFEAAVYAKRTAQTRVAVANGKTVVIGGLMEDRVTDRISKVPLLGDIPWLGALFRRTIQAKSKTELLVFLCPQVALTPAELEQATDGVRARAELLRNAVEPGALDNCLDELDPVDELGTPAKVSPVEPGWKERR